MSQPDKQTATYMKNEIKKEAKEVNFYINKVRQEGDREDGTASGKLVYALEIKAAFGPNKEDQATTVIDFTRNIFLRLSKKTRKEIKDFVQNTIERYARARNLRPITENDAVSVPVGCFFNKDQKLAGSATLWLNRNILDFHRFDHIDGKDLVTKREARQIHELLFGIGR